MYCYVCTDILFFFRYMGLFDCDLPFQIDCKEGSDVGYVEVRIEGKIDICFRPQLF